MYQDFNKKIKELIIAYFINGIQLNWNSKTLKYELKFSEHLIEPRKSPWYNKAYKFNNLEIDYKKLPVLGSDIMARILNINLKEKENDSNYYNRFYINSILEYTQLYKEIKESEIIDISKIDSYGITHDGKKLYIKVLSTKKEDDKTIAESKTIKISLEIFKKKLLDRIISIEDLIEKLNSNVYKPRLISGRKIFIVENRILKEKKYNTYQMDTIKLFLKNFKKIKGIHHLINCIGKHYNLNTIDSRKWTINNGWGSYTYTYIRNLIDIENLPIEDKEVIKFYIYYLTNNKLISQNEGNRYLHIDNCTIGMIQSSGGYTYVSG